jgi:hypothetical protein
LTTNIGVGQADLDSKSEPEVQAEVEPIYVPAYVECQHPAEMEHQGKHELDSYMDKDNNHQSNSDFEIETEDEPDHNDVDIMSTSSADETYHSGRSSSLLAVPATAQIIPGSASKVETSSLRRHGRLSRILGLLSPASLFSSGPREKQRNAGSDVESETPSKTRKEKKRKRDGEGNGASKKVRRVKLAAA